VADREVSIGALCSDDPPLTGDRLLYLPFEAKTLKATTPKFSNIRKTEKMTLSAKSLAGPGYIILNGIRAMNIIGLLAVITASVAMLVKTSVASKFFFFDAVSHVLTAITGSKCHRIPSICKQKANRIPVFLLTSELSLFRSYFSRNWPLLSPAHGFLTLALAMIVLGINMLGNLNKAATSQESLGMPFWRIVIASGIVIFILGFVNLVASYIFRDRKQGITARQVRAHGAVAIHKTPMTSSSVSTGTPSAPELAQSYIPNPIHSTTTSPSKNTSNPFRILTGNGGDRRQSLLPSYHASTTSSTSSSTSSPVKEPVSPSSTYSRATNCTKKRFSGWLGGGRNRHSSLAPPLPLNISGQPVGGGTPQQREMEISAPMGVNPQFAHLVQRPDSALHPSRGTGESEAFRWRPIS
jgi:hypothetical protein